MKRHQSDAEKRKKIKKDQEVVDSQRNAFHRYLAPTSDLHQQPTPIPDDTEKTDMVENVTDNNLSNDNKQTEMHESGLFDQISGSLDTVNAVKHYDDENVIGNKSRNVDRETPTQESTSLDNFYTVTDIALWPTNFGNDFIEYIIRNAPKNVGDITTLKSLYKDNDTVYYRNLSTSIYTFSTVFLSQSSCAGDVDSHLLSISTKIRRS